MRARQLGRGGRRAAADTPARVARAWRETERQAIQGSNPEAAPRRPQRRTGEAIEPSPVPEYPGSAQEPAQGGGEASQAPQEPPGDG